MRRATEQLSGVEKIVRRTINGKECVTVRDACAILAMSPATVRRYLDHGIQDGNTVTKAELYRGPNNYRYVTIDSLYALKERMYQKS